MIQLFSDRESGGRRRDQLVMSSETSRGLVGTVTGKIDQNWFAEVFPDRCEDGRGISGTNSDAVYANLHAIVPGWTGRWTKLGWEGPDDSLVFDLLEYSATKMSKPLTRKQRWHEYFNHYELEFDGEAGREEFRDEVNLILARGGMAFEMDESGKIVRLGLSEHRAVLQELRPDTGDDQLDELLLEALTGFQSRHETTRRQGFERLWDAFERLKTIELGKDKKTKAEALLSIFAPPALQGELRREMKSLTDIGNEFDIRHKETNKVPVPDHAMEYLFHRLAGLVLYLLRHTGRIR